MPETFDTSQAKDPNRVAYTFRPDEVEALIVQPLAKQSVAMQASTLIRPPRGASVTLPAITSDYSTNSTADLMGWVAEGAEAPIATPPKEQAVTLTHHKLAAMNRIPWEQLTDKAYPVLDIYGQSLVRRMIAAIDRAYFATNATDPVTGVGGLDGVNTIPGGTLTNTDALLDAIEHANGHDTEVSTFCMHPATMTALAKLKQAQGSELPLMGVADNPGTSTIAGVPLLQSRFIEPNTIWAIPRNRMVVSMREDVTIKVDENADFGAMTAGMICYARLAMACLEPEAISKITFTS